MSSKTLAFQIPYNIKNQLIPEPHISIHSLLQYNLPPLNNTDHGHKSVDFFSNSEPEDIDDSTITQLQCLPIPSPKLIQDLVMLSHDA